VLVDPFCERAPGETDNASSERKSAWVCCPSFKRNPDLGWSLCSNLVKSKRGKQAGNPFGDGLRYLDDSVVGRYLGVRQGVKTMPNPYEFTTCAKLSEVLMVNALGTHVCSAHNTGLVCELQDCIGFFIALLHFAQVLSLFNNCQYLCKFPIRHLLEQSDARNHASSHFRHRTENLIRRKAGKIQMLNSRLPTPLSCLRNAAS